MSGDPTTALEEPASIVLSRSWAEKCFEDWNTAIGQTVYIDNIVPVEVKGVIEDLPENTDFPLPFIVSYETLLNHRDLFFYSGSWGSCSSNNQVFALLHDDASMEDANRSVALVGEEEYQDESGIQQRIHQLQPIKQLHYDEDFSHSGTHSVSKSRLRVLSVIGLLILLIACFNFINLATAQSLLRSKEVGVRKTLGSSRNQLVFQFLSETGLIVLFSLILGSYLAYGAAPLLKFVSFVPESYQLFAEGDVWVFLIAAGIGITILAGLYPALAISNFSPSRALNSMANSKGIQRNAVRKSLVVLQFGAALALIISAIITLQQLDFIKSQDLGFQKDLIYTFSFNNDESTVSRQEALRNRLTAIPGIESVSLSSDQPISGNTWSTNFAYSSRPDDEDYEMSLRFCDNQYFETYDIPFVAGQAFRPTDTMYQCVINMTVVRRLGLEDPAEAIGETIRLGGGRRSLPITGVVQDFHTHSFRVEHEPLLLTSRNEFYGDAGMKIKSSSDITSTIRSIKQAYDEVLPEQVFDGSFLDESIALFYESDRRLASTCWAFGFLAIFISCLGLFGLATHTVTQRVKEIGIRKVLGANVTSIVGLITSDFLKLVLVALLISSPLAWWFMDNWLKNFVYRIDIEIWVFIAAGLIALFIAFATVSFQSIRAAMANPVNSLRSE